MLRTHGDDKLDFLNDEDYADASDEYRESFELHARVLVKYSTMNTIKYFARQITEMFKDSQECTVKSSRFNG